ncbi:MAG: hypothetical protein RLZZ112_689, partial [Verrucomicrobiota bacterium]
LRPKAKSPVRGGGGGGGEGPRDWKSYFKKTIVLVLVISFAVHLLFLLAFGSVAIFKGSIPKLPFVSQEIAAEAVTDTTPPPPEEEAPVEEINVDPFAQEMPESSPAEESAPALEMLTVVGGANWAPAIPKNAPVSETGVIGGTGKGTGLGTGGAGGKGMATGKQLFGVTIQARKLGVVVSVNKGAQSSGRLPGIFTEIFKEFPDSPVFLTNGGGMMDWDKALAQFNERVEANKKKEKETGKSFPYPKNMERPKAVKFNTGEALNWPPVRGAEFVQDYPGMKEKYPDLFDDLRRRSNVWFITSYKDANACYLAFDELLKRGVEAIYWYNSFDSPIEGKEAERIAQKITESKIEILVQNQGSRAQGMDWLNKVGAKFVK